MAVLVIADHDNAHVRGHHQQDRHRGPGALRRRRRAGRRQGRATPPPPQAAKIDGVRKVLIAESDALDEGIAEAVPGAGRAADGELRRGADAGDRRSGKNFAPRIAAALDVAQISEIIEVVDASTPSCGRSTPATRWRRCRRSDAKKVITVRATALQGRPAKAARRRSRRSPRRRGAAKTHFVGQEVVKSDRPELAARQDRRLRRPRHGLGRGVPAGDRAAGRQAGRRGGRQPRGRRRRLRAQRLPGRPDRQGGRAASSTSPSASPAPSSTWPA